MTKRVAVYARVSTLRQAVNDVSIPDQIREAQTYCEARGWTIAREYVEAGSARDDKRPGFQRMIADAAIDPSPYDIILVHSLSRFYRDAIDQGVYRRKLESHGVLLKSITQEFGEGAQAELVQTILAAADAHTSAETAKHVKRAMKENARQGFWNGARPPIGYQTYVAETRGDKQKKKLSIETKGAEIVRLVYRLFLTGDGASRPMGIKQIVEYLNARNYRTNTGGIFYTSTVHMMLTRSTYTGVHYYNLVDSRTRKPRPREDWIVMDTPVIIDPETFQTVQSELKQRSPKKTAPRVVNSPVMLSGLARCDSCGGNLMLTTGKNGRYRYYACANKHIKGRCGCGKPIRIPEQKLDDLVTGAMAERLLEPRRLRTLLDQAIQIRRQTNDQSLLGLKQIRQELRDTEQKITRLYEALTDGMVTDSKSFRDHLGKLENKREECIRLKGIRERETGIPGKRLTNAQLNRVSDKLRDLLTSGPRAFRKEYMKLLIDNIEVGKTEIRISGTNAALIAATQAKPGNPEKVPGFVREWCTRQDSNL